MEMHRLLMSEYLIICTCNAVHIHERCDGSLEDAHGCVMVYDALCTCYWPHPHRMSPYNTCTWSRGINFPLVKIPAPLARGFRTHPGRSVKVAGEGGCGSRKCCRGRLILTPRRLSQRSLFLCFFLFMFLLYPSFSPPSLLVKGKR